MLKTDHYDFNKLFAVDQVRAHSLVVLENAMLSRGFDRAYDLPEKAWVDYVTDALSLLGEKEDWVDMNFILGFALMPEIGLKETFPDKYDH